MAAEFTLCDLPKELLVSIADRLDTPFEINRFRAVCRSSRFSIPRPIFPVLRFQWTLSDYDRTLFVTIVYCLEECTTGKQWLVRLRESADGKVEIKDAFGRSLDDHQLPANSKVINLLNFRVSEITKLYRVHINPHRDINETVTIGLPSAHNFPIVAMGVFSNAKVEIPLESVILYNGTLKPFPGSSIVKHNGKLYEFHPNGLVDVYESCDYSIKRNATIHVPGFNNQNRNRYYLVSFGGNLFLVNKVDNQALKFKYYSNWKEKAPGNGTRVNYNGSWYSSNKYIEVYKFDEKQQQWVQVTNLGDGAFILCEDRNFGVSAQEFTGIEKGFVYFLCSDPAKRGNTVVWGYNLEKGTLCHGLDCFNICHLGEQRNDV